METTKRLAFLLLVILLAISPAQTTEQSTKLSGTYTASCLVKITCDPIILPLNLDTINSLLRSSAVGGKAARQVLDLTPDQVPNLFTIEYEQLASSSIDTKPEPSKKSSSGLKEDMNEYEYAMMMEAEYAKMLERLSTSSPKPSSSPSTSGRSRSSSGRSETSIYDELMYDTTSGTRGGRRRTSQGRSSSDPYGRTAAIPSVPADGGAYLFSLNVQLSEDMKPAANEYMNALIDNLRQALIDAYQTQRQELQIALDFAQSQRDHAQSQLAKATQQAEATVPTLTVRQNPANVAVYEQMEKILDLANLTPQTSFADVIDRLKNSVSPPLQIQPNWKDLLEKAEIEPQTLAGMDPLIGVKVRKALEILLASVSSEFAQLNYVVDEGVILIATEETLPDRMETHVYDIPALAYSVGAASELVNAIKETIEPESWYDLSESGEGTIRVYLGKKLAIRQTPEIHQKIQDFLQSMTMDSPVSIPSEAPIEMLQSDKYDLLREKKNLEVEIAQLKARPPVIEEQIMRIKKEIDEKIAHDSISEEFNKIIDMQVKRLERFKKLVDDGDINGGVADAEEKLARAKIELAQRREQLSKSAGGDQLEKFSHELATLTIDLAEKKAMLKVINDQFSQAEQQLMAATISDPQVTRIHHATRLLEDIDRNINELNRRLIDLQPPTVSVIGG